MKRKNLAFSMAEVMITLVILGVIAVLTVPGLVDSANKRINEAAESKADYVIGQGALRLQAECPRLRCTTNSGNDKSGSILWSLLDSVKANEKIKYGVSAKYSNNIYVLAFIEGDDVPILYVVNDKGVGRRAKSGDITNAQKAIVAGRAGDGNVAGSTLKGYLPGYLKVDSFNQVRLDDGSAVDF